MTEIVAWIRAHAEYVGTFGVLIMIVFWLYLWRR